MRGFSDRLIPNYVTVIAFDAELRTYPISTFTSSLLTMLNSRATGLTRMSFENDVVLPPIIDSAAGFEPADSPSPRRGLKRISAACQRCRRRKQKV